MNQKLIDQLRETMHLNTYETRVWLALLAQGISSAGELADISKVPRSRCYDVLENLEKKGFVFTKVGKPIKYMAIQPEEVLQNIKKQSIAEQARMVDLLDAVKDTEIFHELKTLYATGVNYIDNSEIMQSIKGRQNINMFLKEIFGKAQKEILIYTSQGGIKRKIKAIKKAKVQPSVMVVIHSPSMQKSSIKNVAIRNFSPKVRMISVDNEEIAFFTTPEEIHPDQENLVWIKSSVLTETLKDILT